MTKKLKIYKIADVETPNLGTEDSACFDFFIPEYSKDIKDFITSQTNNFCDNNGFVLKPNTSIMIPSGIKMKVPKNHCLIFKNKSGIATKNKLLVGACVVDSDYRNEVFFNLHNVGKENQTLQFGQKIIQGKLEKVIKTKVVKVKNNFKDKTSRRGGFGSTGLFK